MSERQRVSSRSPISLGRILAVAAAITTGLLTGVDLGPLVAGGLGLYAIALAPFSDTRASAYIDTVVSAGVLLAFSSDLTPFLALSVIAAFNAGARLGPVRGPALSWSLSVAQLPTLVPLALDGAITLGVLAALVGLHPITAAAAGLANQRTRGERSDREVLEDTYHVLTELNRIVDRVPAGLDPRSVTRATLDELVARTSSPRAFLFTGAHGLLRPVASHGAGRTAIPVSDRDIVTMSRDDAVAIIDRQHLPQALRGAAGALDHWLVAPLRVDDALVGAMVAAVDRDDDHKRIGAQVEELAREAALAIENARLFSEAQARAVDVARRRIAHDLHDGVAQSLAHIRMELDLLGRASLDSQKVADETKRLANVAGRALDDVRATITGLRSSANDDGIVAVLRDHIEGLRGLGGPEVAFEAIGNPVLDPADEDEIIRITQEATSNAVRHSGARTVMVSLEAEADLFSLVVEDDGRGIPETVGRDGVGLKAMRSRAARLGAQLTIRDRRGGGTVVALTYNPQPTPSSRGGRA